MALHLDAKQYFFAFLLAALPRAAVARHWRERRALAVMLGYGFRPPYRVPGEEKAVAT